MSFNEKDLCGDIVSRYQYATNAAYQTKAVDGDIKVALFDNPVTKVARRNPVTYRYDLLNWDFVRGLADLANVGSAYDQEPGVQNYSYNVLTGDKSPMNHVFEHLREYMAGTPSDHGGTLGGQLISAAYNLMMEYHYVVKHGTSSVGRALYADHTDAAPEPDHQHSVPVEEPPVPGTVAEPTPSAWERLRAMFDHPIDDLSVINDRR